MSRPDVPSGIFVTPSSPRTVVDERNSPPASPMKVIDKDSRGTRSRSLSRTRRNANSGKSSPIGLGLPIGSPATPSIDEDRPPALPEKIQSVSSPLPSRSLSPVPKIVFAENVVMKEGRGRDNAVASDQRQTGTVKRARSLSGFLGRTPPVIHAEDSSGKHTQAPMTIEVTPVNSEGTAPVKSQGVLGWLGVRKTIGRRQSESKMKGDRSITGEPDRTVPSNTPNQVGEREKVRNRESVGLETELGEVGRTNRRPRSRDDTSGNTVSPQAGSSRLTSIFPRKASSRLPEALAENSSDYSLVEAQPIPGATLRNSSAFSSQSSLAVVAKDVTPPSSAVSPGETMSSSPVTAADGFLFGSGGGSHWGPGIRPWMDSMTGGYGSNRSSTSSPLESMPEQEILDMGLVPSIIPRAREGRVRSWSDAPLPQISRSPHAAVESHLAVGSAESSSSTRSLQTSPLTPTRPKLEVRTSSGNSAIVGRMRLAFGKSSGRSRGNPLLRQLSSDADEFGSLRLDDRFESQSMRPSFSSSSDVASPRLSAQDDPHVALLGLDGDQQIFPNEPPFRSPKMPLTTSMSSLSTGSMRGEVHRESQAQPPPNRPRASTMSNSPSIHSLASPIPTGSVLIAASPRRRPSAILRLSSGIFGTNTASLKAPSSLFPLPPRSGDSISSGITGSVASSGEVEISHSGQTVGEQASVRNTPTAMEINVTKQVSAVQGEETPGQWLDRVVEAIGRNEIANVLAKR